MGVAMLLAFRVTNHRSICNEQELSFVRSSRMTASQVPTAAVDDHGHGWDAAVTPVAALYGGNASGKSNVLWALMFMEQFVQLSHTKWQPSKAIPYDPFRLDNVHANSPSRYEVELAIHGMRVQYGFEIDSQRVLREWLYVYPHSRRQTWLERDVDSDEEWHFGKSLGGRNRIISELTRPNSLFLSAAASSGHKRLSAIYNWFSEHLKIASPDNFHSRLRFTFTQLEKRPEVARELTRLLQFADLGVCDIEVTHQEYTDEERERIIRIAKGISSALESGEISEEEASNDVLSRVLDEFGTRVQLKHTCDGNSAPVSLPFDAESHGTRSLIALGGPVLQALRNGYTLLVDEVDTSLHPRLVAELVRLYQSPETNPKQAQLIFTSHDTSLLGNLIGDVPVLERDQIWFVEKDDSGASLLYPLTDFSPRKLENLERGYLQGRYGAVPFLDRSNLVSMLESQANQ
jgi:uncharacterized protein